MTTFYLAQIKLYMKKLKCPAVDTEGHLNLALMSTKVQYGAINNYIWGKNLRGNHSHIARSNGFIRVLM